MNAGHEVAQPGYQARMTATRRQFIAAGAAGLAFGPAFWRSALVAQARAPQSAYGPLQAADARGLMLPPGFRSREIARAGQPVAGYPWHIFSDGQSTFATADGGWILVSNSESTAATGGGSSAIRFKPTATSRRPTGSSPARTRTAPAAARRGARGSRARSSTPATCGSATRPRRARA